MKTSKTIKQAQYRPPTIVSALVRKGKFRVAGRSQAYYNVAYYQNGRLHCDCPAMGLCRHITAVVKKYAELRGWRLVQVWTSPEDAKRQKRRTAEFWAGKRPFWVTYAHGPTSRKEKALLEWKAAAEKLQLATRYAVTLMAGSEKAVANREEKELNELVLELMYEYMKL